MSAVQCRRHRCLLLLLLLLIPLLLLLRPANPPLQIHVVEEHHEVVTAWAEDARRRHRSQGRWLLHVDAHADLALPRLHPDLPLFHAPTHPRQVAAMMQKNDVFIVAAALARLVSRVLWLYPDWAAAAWNGSWLLGVGTAGAAVCGCVDGRCEAEDATGDVVRTSCRPRLHLPVRAVAESGAVDLPAGPFLLDIDQDFFGVQPPADLLQRAGVPPGRVRALAALLHQRLRAGRDEAAADCWFRRLLRRAGRKRAPPPVDRHLHRLLSSLTPGQRTALSEVGVCLGISPRTFMPVHAASPPPLGLCLGAGPSDFLRHDLLVHAPPAHHTTARMDRLLRRLAALPTRPDLITVCRSSRDGYLPRPGRRRLETALLTRLRRLFDVDEKNVIFDRHLWRARKCEED